MSNERATTGTAGAPAPLDYDVFISYSHSDVELVRPVVSQLRQLGVSCFFDEDIMIPGEKNMTLADHMSGSRAVAVLSGPNGSGRWHVQEAAAAVQSALDRGIRVFLVKLPDSPDKPTDLPAWLQTFTEVDLRPHMATGVIARDGLVMLYAGALNMTPMRARPLVDQLLAAPTRRALILAFNDYARYTPTHLKSVDHDLGGMTQYLSQSGTPTRWQVQVQDRSNREGVRMAINRLFAGARADDTLCVYFTGHGDVDVDQPYLCCFDSDPDDLGTAYPIKSLAVVTRKSSCLNKIVVLDCCYSGEADDLDWGEGTAVFLTSRQQTPDQDDMSELTKAWLDACKSGAMTTGALRDALVNKPRIRFNQNFADQIELPAVSESGTTRDRSAPRLARLGFDEHGCLSVKLANQMVRAELNTWSDGQRELVQNLIVLVDAIVSMAPPDQIPIDIVSAALKSLGAELLASVLCGDVSQAIEDWEEVRLELTFHDRWRGRDAWERMPWESLALCSDGDRPVSLERIVGTWADAKGPQARPRRVIAWSFMPNAAAPERKGLSTLLASFVENAPTELTQLIYHEPTVWDELFDASMNNTFDVGDGPLRRSDFDTFVLFAPITYEGGEPAVWFSGEKAMQAVPVSKLVEQVKKWKELKYFIVETVAGHPSGEARSTGARQFARSLQATTELATRVARSLNSNVIAVCHSPQFPHMARSASAQGVTGHLSFAGALLQQLVVDPSALYESAKRARAILDNRLSRPGAPDVGLHLGLPVVCRPDAPRTTTGQSDPPPYAQAGTPPPDDGAGDKDSAVLVDQTGA